MGDKEVLALSNPNIHPGDELVFSLLGNKKDNWQNILKYLLDNHTDVSWSWNWYNDGKQWLFKVVRKSKTIFWAAILTTCQFRITFYFGEKAEPLILTSGLPGEIKNSYLNGPLFGKIKAVTLLVNSEEDVNTVKELIEIKLKIK
jgi:hypothetical protein